MRRAESMSRLDETISDVAYILDVLMVYRNIVQTGCCNDCGEQKTCNVRPNYGQMVRYNCPLYRRAEHD